MNSIIESTRSMVNDLILTKEYRTKQFTKNFDRHISALVDTTLALSESGNTLGGNTATISDQQYWESEAFILEKLDDIQDEFLLDELDNLEYFVYEKIKEHLGNNYEKNDERLGLIIDNSVNDILLAVRFNFFTQKDAYINPWESASDIIFNNNVLFSFSKDLEKLKSMGFDIKNSESEVLEESKINIVAKGNRLDYAYGFVYDLLGLRNLVVNILEDKSCYGEKAMKMDDIISHMRKFGVAKNRIADSQIKTWIIKPLKRNNKIGSHKEGYFILKDCKSIALSYESHYANLLGYFRTLENHRKIAMKSNCNEWNFEKHITFFKTKFSEF